MAAAATTSTTSKKHRQFVSEPMGDKPVTELPGVGPVLAAKLTEAGFDKAYVVLGQFLVLKKDLELFEMWFRDVTGGNRKHSFDCSRALADWCDEFL